MARTNRPPIAAAKLWATGQLVTEYEARFRELTDEYLAEAGWTQKTETVTRWVNNPTSIGTTGE